MGEVRRPTYTVADPKTGERVQRQSNVWWIRYYRNGRRHEESSHSTKKGDAERLLKLREGDVAKGLPVSAKLGQLRFDAAAADVITDYEINGRKSTRDVEARIRLHLKPYFGGRRMASITTADVRAYIAHRQEPGAANATVNRELAVLKRAFRLAKQAGTVMYVPHIPMLRENNVRSGFFERDEFEAVREQLPAPLRPVVTFGYLTGWRVNSEVLPLTWAQVDRTTKTIRLEPGATKNSEGRTLPCDLLPELDDVMAGQWAERRRLAVEGTLCPYVFHRDGEPVRYFRDAWVSACKAAGLPGRLVHDFRRTAVRNLVRAGVPEKISMGITGHKTRSVFDRYDIVNEADLRNALGQLAATTGKEKGKIANSGRVAQMPARP